MAPYGKSIRDIAEITAGIDNSGACSGTETDDAGNEVEVNCDEVSSTLESILKFDTSNAKDKVYPLIIKVTGNEHGKPPSSKPWVFIFDVKKWHYTIPAGYPLADSDF